MTDDDAFARLPQWSREDMAPLVPGLIEGMAILLANPGLLRVDDGGSRHDDGSTPSWCRLVEREK